MNNMQAFIDYAVKHGFQAEQQLSLPLTITHTWLSRERMPLTAHMSISKAKRLRRELKKHMPSYTRLVLRGRGSRKLHGNQRDLPLRHAKHVTIYVERMVKKSVTKPF